MAALWQPPVLVSWITALLGLRTVITGIVFRYNGTPLATADEIALGIAVFILPLVRALGLGRKILESRQ